MLIQPVEPVFVVVKLGQEDYMCQMLSLSDSELELKSNHYFEKETHVSFHGKFFRGHASIQGITFSKLHFIYQMNIEEIQFQPGLLINTRL
ncbi:hypothetical protein [Legionella saoudiensis]|uniref:hypothetical protein n=1 Tax=Legionella saoudiensis TaxID=1750561 RepID=UPI0007305D39|nr:hypothetical protein [Legionella saoudiensis]